MTEWFEESFGEEYLQLYPHRDDEDARRAVDLVGAVVPLAGRRVLDLACGPGRHAAQLVVQGARVTGLDLSEALLARARARLGGRVALVRGDMRCLPFRDRTFDVVVNLFTSFGYFSDDTQQQAVVNEAARTVVTGGCFVLDYFNAALVRSGLVPEEQKTMGNQQVRIARKISSDGRFVVKEMKPEKGRGLVERVRLLSPADLEGFLGAAGLSIRQRFGAYDRRPLGPDTPRAIFVAVRSA